ncbi:acetylxylan esterase [Hamadaea tsunoensis]|uniref:acetylxylan esterase n=1 Tax=Hamadaea tsunoensis TaxID=53368 RepID=UPI00042A8FFA|nr:acetylxylan esterase [Hamadaea tsunoensis]
MAFFDLPLAELRSYAPTVTEPGDFDAFWKSTLDESRSAGGDPVFEEIDNRLTLVRTFDVTFSGYAGQPVKAWLTVPANADGPLPAVVQYQGYNGGRGVPHQNLLWANAGYAHFMMDTRGQGSGWSLGATADPEGSTPQQAGFMTKGILDPATYFYRRVYTDAVRAVDAARTSPWVDAARVSVTGGSQGGGISIAVSGLVGDLTAAMPDVPFLCNFERAVGMTDKDPYSEISRYLTVHRFDEAAAYRTLSYFDGVSFARRATAPGLFSTALMDEICPPSTVFAAYNAWAHEDKDIKVYRFNGHEGGSFDHLDEQLGWLRERVPRG